LVACSIPDPIPPPVCSRLSEFGCQTYEEARSAQGIQYDQFSYSPNARRIVDVYRSIVGVPALRVQQLGSHLKVFAPNELISAQRLHNSIEQLSLAERKTAKRVLAELEKIESSKKELEIESNPDVLRTLFAQHGLTLEKQVHSVPVSWIEVSASLMQDEDTAKNITKFLRSNQIRDAYLLHDKEIVTITDKLSPLYFQNGDPFEYGPEHDVAHGVREMAKQIQLSITSLMNNDIYRDAPEKLQASDMDSRLIYLLNRELNDLLFILSPSQYDRLRDYHIVSESDGNSNIWIEVREEKKEINVYPALIRSAFAVNYRLYGTSIQNAIEKETSGSNEGPPTSYRSELLEKEALKIEHCFQSAFTFAIAHELAHVLLTDETENDADTWAVNTLERNLGKVPLGVFDTVFLRAFSEENLNNFGSISTKNLRQFESRLAKLNAELSSDEGECALPRYFGRITTTEYHPLIQDEEINPCNRWMEKEEVEWATRIDGQRVRNGWGCSWNENGVLIEKGVWDNGSRIGKWQFWDNEASDPIVKEYGKSSYGSVREKECSQQLTTLDDRNRRCLIENQNFWQELENL